MKLRRGRKEDKPEPKAEVMADEATIKVKLVSDEPAEETQEFEESSKPTGLVTTIVSAYNASKLLDAILKLDSSTQSDEERRAILGFIPVREMPMQVAARTLDEITRLGESRTESAAQILFRHKDTLSLAREGFLQDGIMKVSEKMLEIQQQSQSGEIGM